MKLWWIEYVPVNWRALNLQQPKWDYIFQSVSESFHDTTVLFGRLSALHKDLPLRIVSSTSSNVVWRIPNDEIPFIDPHTPSTLYQFKSQIKPIEIHI
jgi:hypothetical protein